jgi:hypothetical protein
MYVCIYAYMHCTYMYVYMALPYEKSIHLVILEFFITLVCHIVIMRRNAVRNDL